MYALKEARNCEARHGLLTDPQHKIARPNIKYTIKQQPVNPAIK